VKSAKAEDFAQSATSNAASQAQKLVIKTNNKSFLVDSEEIILIERKGRKTVIHTATGQVSTNEPLQSLLGRLDETMFFRCHKGFVINTAKVIEM
jgi:DNA-binding LytR/AlgR family response regulator